MPKGEGKPFLARWVYRGKVYTKSTGEAGRRKALKELERLTRPFREEREIDVLRAMESRIKAAEETAVRKPFPLSELFAKFRDLPGSRDLSRGTLNLYEDNAEDVAAFMKARGKSDVRDVTEEDAERFLEDLAARTCPAAYNVRLAFYKRLWREFGNGANPFEKFAKRKASKTSSRRALSGEEAARVMSEAAKDADDELLFALGAYTGLRVSDCALLKAEDVDLSENLLRVVPIKTRRHMAAALEIPMHPALRKVVEARLKEKPSGYLSERNASMYERGTLTERTRDVFSRAGIETSETSPDGRRKLVCGFHSLRHTFVSMSIDAGMNPLLVQRIVGHSSAAMTDHYYHANRKALEEGIAKMPNFAA